MLPDMGGTAMKRTTGRRFVLGATFGVLASATTTAIAQPAARPGSGTMSVGGPGMMGNGGQGMMRGPDGMMGGHWNTSSYLMP